MCGGLKGTLGGFMHIHDFCVCGNCLFFKFIIRFLISRAAFGAKHLDGICNCKLKTKEEIMIK